MISLKYKSLDHDSLDMPQPIKRIRQTEDLKGSHTKPDSKS